MSDKCTPTQTTPPTTEEKTLTIRLTGKAVDQLTTLKEKSEAGTSTEVVKNAIRTYDALNAYRDTDGSIIVEAPNGKRVRLLLP
jgi:hypothetical protein